ncbi:hypothetical protein RAD16_12875 [Bradyrhizobium sp. 18BD]
MLIIVQMQVKNTARQSMTIGLIIEALTRSTLGLRFAWDGARSLQPCRTLRSKDEETMKVPTRRAFLGLPRNAVAARVVTTLGARLIEVADAMPIAPGATAAGQAPLGLLVASRPPSLRMAVGLRTPLATNSIHEWPLMNTANNTTLINMMAETFREQNP